MASKRKRGKHHKSTQTGFQDSDFQWLAERFQKQSAHNPNLTLKEFAIRHGVQPDWIRRFISPDDNPATEVTISIGRAAEHFGVSVRTIREWISSGEVKGQLINGARHVCLNAQDIHQESQRVINLWHGTTENRAKSIAAEGFRERQGGHHIGLWFTKSRKFAHRFATWRAENHREIPAVIACEIDLEKYAKFRRTHLNIYVFYTPVGSEVIRDVTLLQPHKFSKRARYKESESIDVTVTKASGKLGVLAWINRYLQASDAALIGESHSAVGSIHRWVEAEYAAGRVDAISDDEMLMQTMLHLKSI